MIDGMSNPLLQEWKVYSAHLRHNFRTSIIEIQTVSGEAVIFWSGFDATDWPQKTRLEIARSIVREHNSAIKPSKKLQ